MNKVQAWLKENQLLVLLFWFSILLIFSYSWLPGGLDVDSCNYSLVAKEALRTNTWVKLWDPTINAYFYYHFPLYIWVSAFLFKVFGLTVVSAVLFSSLSAVALVILLYYFGKTLGGKWVGFFAGAAYLMTNHVLRLARLARLDIPVSLFITAAIFCFILANRRNRLYYLLFGLFTCLAIFTKDISGVFPVAIVCVYLLFTGQWREFFHPLFLLGLLIAFGPVAIWVKLDDNTLFGTWFRCNFMHLYKAEFFKSPWYYYIKAISEKYFYFLPFALYGGYLSLRRAFFQKRPEFYLLIIWVVIFPLAFSFGRHKLHYFIMPIYPAAAMLTAIAFDRILKDTIKPKVAVGLKYSLVLFATVMLCFPLDIRSRRFAEVVAMAPAIEGIVRRIPEAEFIVYNYDTAAVLWYVRPLSRVSKPNDMAELERLLKPAAAPIFCFIDEKSYSSLNTDILLNTRILLTYKTRLLVVLPKNIEIPIDLGAQ